MNFLSISCIHIYTIRWILFFAFTIMFSCTIMILAIRIISYKFPVNMRSLLSTKAKYKILYNITAKIVKKNSIFFSLHSK